MKHHKPEHPPVIKETKHWLAVNKPAGLNVEQLWDYPSVETQVKNYLKGGHLREPYLGIVHRIDRPVSGVLLLAKKKSALRHLNQQFAERKVQKVYWAICSGVPPKQEGTLVHYLLKDQKNKRAEAFTEPRKGAILGKLEYRVVKNNGDWSQLEIRPLSGKFHQIRVQLASIGCPLLGDEKYGGPIGDQPNEIALHARELSFVDPLSEQKETIIADLPINNKLWEAWRGNS
jgi:23S rRNA pseudouridine1911/1915/1917 synthase